MKGKKCNKNHQRNFYLRRVLPALLLMGFSSLFLNSYSANAETISINPVNTYLRAYKINNGNLVTQIWNNTGTLPKTILSYESGSYKYLYGFSVDFGINDNLTTKFKSVKVTVRVNQSNESGNSSLNGQNTLSTSNISMNVDTLPSTGFGGSYCSANRVDNYNVDYTCTKSFTNNETINAVALILGYPQTTTSNVEPFAYICGTDKAPGCAGGVKVTSVTYELNGSNDVNTDLLNQQINQNNILIEQNNTIIEQDSEDRDNISSTSEDAEDSGNEAGEDAENVGTTLFNAFGTLITALTNVHQTNCNLTMPAVNMQGTNINFGTLDLCENEVPNEIKTLGSLMLVFLIVPMGINCAKRMLGLYNELLGGK